MIFFVRSQWMTLANEMKINFLSLSKMLIKLKGHPRLVHALSTLYSKLVNRKVDAFTEILVTCGAYEALFASIFGFVLANVLNFYRSTNLCM